MKLRTVKHLFEIGHRRVRSVMMNLVLHSYEFEMARTAVE